MNYDWLDEVVDGKPKDAEYWQIDYIDSLIHRTSLCNTSREEISNKIFEKGFTELEADEIIKHLKENEVYSDPKDQYKQFAKNGMFK